MIKTVLLTGFEPFNKAKVNPALGAAMVDEPHPDIVIAVGQAGGRAEISVERVAINVDGASSFDQAGRCRPRAASCATMCSTG